MVGPESTLILTVSVLYLARVNECIGQGWAIAHLYFETVLLFDFCFKVPKFAKILWLFGEWSNVNLLIVLVGFLFSLWNFSFKYIGSVIPFDAQNECL